MKVYLKRAVSFLLSFTLCFSMAVPASAANETNTLGVSFSAALDNAELYVSDTEQTVTLTISASDAIVLDGMGVKLTSDSPITLTALSGGEGIGAFAASEYNLTTGQITWMTDDGENASGITDLVVATFSIPANTPAGNYTLGASWIELTSDYGEIWEPGASATTTLTISEPAAPAPDYEIYYTLSGSSLTDSADDAYTDYNIGDTVTAEIFLKNNSGADLTMQAYDIFLTYSGLNYNGTETMAGVALTAADNGAAEEDETVTHIQLVKDQTTIELKDGVETSLGTIEFKIEESAVYNEELPITLTIGTDTKDVTNFAVSNDDTSHYPVDTSEIDGAEVKTTHTVKFNTDGGTEILDQTVGHNLTAQKPADPEKQGFAFKGWYTDGTYAAAFDFATLITADTEIFAKWETNTVKVTWMNGTTQLGDPVEVEYNTVPVYSGETPTKTDATGQFTYTFVGWTTTEGGTTAEPLTAVTQDTVYYAVFTSETNKYDINWSNQDGSALDKDEDITWGTDLSTIAPAAPEKDADEIYTYTFAGWATEPNAESGTPAAALGTVTGDATYYAAFAKTLIEYTVTYSDDGTTDSDTVNYNGKVTLPAAKGKDGYTFDGWYSGSTKIGDAGAEYTVTGDIELTAKYTIVTYTITYMENGGTSVQDDTYTVEDAVTLPTISKEGATFGGWFESSDFSGSAVTEIVKGTTGNKTYYAMWTNNDYQITNDTIENGTVNAVNSKDNTTSANKDDVINVTITPGTGFDLTQDTVTYTHVDENGNPILDENGDPITGNIAVTKQDNGTYTGTFNMPASDVKISAAFQAIDYTVEVGTVNKGAVTIQNGDATTEKLETAHVGDKITLNVIPDSGYQIKSVSYTSEGGTAQIIAGTGNVYTFDMPAANVTVTAEFETISYTITYNTNGGSVIEPGRYTVEETVTLPDTSVKTGYTFEGWYNNEELSGTAVTEIPEGSTENKTFWAKWTPNENTAYQVNHYQQNIDGDANEIPNGYTLKETDNLTGTTDSKVTPDRKTYEGFTAPGGKEITIAADGTTVLNYYYTRNTYAIDLDEKGGSYADGVTEPTSYVYGTSVTLPSGTEITMTGYSFDGWYDAQGNKVTQITTMDTGDKTLTAKWNLIPYQITFNLAGGTLAEGTANPMPYDINTEVSLPAATKEYYTFAGWTVTTADGNWAENAEYDASNLIVGTGKHGNVTLTAQWNRSATFAVEQYKYALNGYWMLRVDATDVDEGKEYRFNGVPMFYMSKASDVNNTYLLDSVNDRGVFYTLISGDYVADGDLTEAGYDLLKIEACANGRSEIEYDGDINADGVVNIADANAVYQMIVNGGAYYQDGQLDTLARLKADMDTAMTTGTNEHRGSIADVNKIVDKINGVTQ